MKNKLTCKKKRKEKEKRKERRVQSVVDVNPVLRIQAAKCRNIGRLEYAM
jgi:hypothetical protein